MSKAMVRSSKARLESDLPGPNSQILDREFADLIALLAMNPFPWSDWGKYRVEKERAAKILLEKLRKLRIQPEAMNQWQSLFSAAYVLAVASTIKESATRTIAGDEVVSEQEFGRFLERYPPSNDEERRKRRQTWREAKRPEKERRKIARELVGQCEELSNRLSQAAGYPLVRSHLAEAGATEIAKALREFSSKYRRIDERQPYQQDNAAKMRQGALQQMARAFQLLTGKPCFGLIAEMELLVRCTSSGKTPSSGSIRQDLLKNPN